MMGGLSLLAVGFVIGVAIAWVLPAARAAGQTEKPAREPDPGARPKNDQPSPVKLDADNAVRVRHDDAGDVDPTGYGTALDQLIERDKALWDKTPRLRDVRGCDPPVNQHPFTRFFRNSFWGAIAKMPWVDFFESKGFGASFGGLVSIVTLQMAGASARSTFALTLLIVAGYWLAFDKPR